MAERWILQFCHSHYGPFADVTRQYAALFKGSPYKVLTVYLTGEPCESARQISASDEVIFLDFSSRSVGGLKLAAIRALKKIAASRDFRARHCPPRETDLYRLPCHETAGNQRSPCLRRFQARITPLLRHMLPEAPLTARRIGCRA